MNDGIPSFCVPKYRRRAASLLAATQADLTAKGGCPFEDPLPDAAFRWLRPELAVSAPTDPHDCCRIGDTEVRKQEPNETPAGIDNNADREQNHAHCKKDGADQELHRS